MKFQPVDREALSELQNGYIPAPYVLEEGESINDRYLEPVYFQNENGPTIGVTTCGVIVRDGLYFKDLDNTGVLDPYKDWRLDNETRARDMITHLSLLQQAGLVHNNLMNNPVVPKREQARDENGEYIFSKIFPHHDPEHEDRSPLKGLKFDSDDQDVLERKIPTGVYRGEMNMEAGMIALYVNAGSQMLEYNAASDHLPAIPYTLLTNPINIGYPDQLGVGAAAQRKEGLDMLREMADTDRKMMLAAGIHGIYGPQVDVATDPRWPRNNGTYGELPEVTSAIITELVDGYQCGREGTNKNSAILTVKHFPGDAPSENGFEPHQYIGQWRLYPTEGSLAKYHLPPFEAAIRAGANGIMPDYSRPTLDHRSAVQYYKGKRVGSEPVPTAYNKELITDLLRNEMGFQGYVNSDSGVTTVQTYGVEELTTPERYAKLISAGCDALGVNPDPQSIIDAVEQGLLPKKDLDRANYNRLMLLLISGRVDNPYLDPDHADHVRRENYEGARAKALEANRQEVVLVKNHENVLPMRKGAVVYVEALSGDNPATGIMAKMGVGNGAAIEDVDQKTKAALSALLKEKGFTVTEDPAEADYVYLHIWPCSNGFPFYQFAMPTIEIGDIELEERVTNTSQKKTGKTVVYHSLHHVERIRELSELAHAKGAKVIATVVVNNPWILTPVEPYVDGMTFQYTTSLAALQNAFRAQADVLAGDYSPTGKLSLTMVSSPEVIAISEKEIDGEMREICASPNDVPGYDKDRYIAPEVLSKVPGGSYAYFDADGNYYRSGFGLHYESDQ